MKTSGQYAFGRRDTLLLGFMFSFWLIFLHSSRVASNIQIEAEGTSLFVALGFAGIFFIIAGSKGKI